MGNCWNRENVPSSAISFAASRNPAHAVRASVPPTLIRRTPRLAASEAVTNGALISRFTGLGDTAAMIAGDLLDSVDARGIEAVRTGFGVRAKPLNRLLDVRASNHEPLRSPGENNTSAAFIDRPSRGAHPLYGQLEPVKRIQAVAGRVFDRQARDPGCHRKLHVRINLLRIDREAALEISINGHRDGVHDEA